MALTLLFFLLGNAVFIGFERYIGFLKEGVGGGGGGGDLLLGGMGSGELMKRCFYLTVVAMSE